MKKFIKKGRIILRRKKLDYAIELILCTLCVFTIVYFDTNIFLRETYVTIHQNGTIFLASNIIPIITLIVICARRLAMARSAKREGKRASPLHTRLVAIFAATAVLPTVFIALFSSFLIESGMSFWFSDTAKTLLTTTNHVASAYISQNVSSLMLEMPPMEADFRYALGKISSIQDPRFSRFMIEQFRNRHFNELALLSGHDNGPPSVLAFVNISADQTAEMMIPSNTIKELNNGLITYDIKPNRIEVRGTVAPKSRLYLYASRKIDPLVFWQTIRAKSALRHYANLLAQSKKLQVRLDAGLLIFAVVIILVFMWLAVAVADRLIEPISILVTATRKITSGDLSVRVSPPKNKDEIWSLSAAFNRMARRMQGQTEDLMSANSQLYQRRVFIETVFSSISTGIISTDLDYKVQLVNQKAIDILKLNYSDITNKSLISISRDIGAFVISGRPRTTLHLATSDGHVVLSIKSFEIEHGAVITLDDITQQQIDQKRAAWSDVARRIAHEIKNPLTPIQLAAERLQRRFSGSINIDLDLFNNLTSTIMRQVSDIRLMVDEFSSFARLADPVFRKEDIYEIVREAVFLFEVAHPEIRFITKADDRLPYVLCDRSMLGRAISNIIKNSVESINSKSSYEINSGLIEIIIRFEKSLVYIEFLDNGSGFPDDLSNLTDPYITNRDKGTGLGLAIVKKIVEEHFGTLALEHRKSGGARVLITLDIENPPLIKSVE